MNTPSPAETGFRLTALYAPSLRLEVVDGSASPEPFSTDDQVRIGWDWAWLEPNRAFEVLVTLERAPTLARPEAILVRMIGRFEIAGAATSVQVAEFALKNATAIIVPYARQAFSQLTMQGPFGAQLIPPINVAEAVGRFDPSLATAARQTGEAGKTRATTA
jgi:preprotein translocase subunit SecB